MHQLEANPTVAAAEKCAEISVECERKEVKRKNEMIYGVKQLRCMR